MKFQELELNIGIGGGNPYRVKTGINVPQEMEYYYIPTDYKEPLKCRLIDYTACLSVNNVLRIMATVKIEFGNGKHVLKDIQPELLFNTKNLAAQYYLDHKKELNFDYLKEDKND